MSRHFGLKPKRDDDRQPPTWPMWVVVAIVWGVVGIVVYKHPRGVGHDAHAVRIYR